MKHRTLDFSHILASSVHDMKNSLGLLINQLDDITDSIQPTHTDLAKQLSHLKYQSKRVNNQLVQLLALFKIQNDQYLVNVQSVNVAEYLDEVMLPIRDLFQERGIEIQIDVANDLDGYFDPTLVAGVINNIMNNAYKYTTSKVALSAYSEMDWLVIQIKDNGPGYPQEMLAKSAASQTGINTETGSTGLGLYFSDEVAKLHVNRGRHGHIALNNVGLGSGSGGCFRIYLP